MKAITKIIDIIFNTFFMRLFFYGEIFSLTFTLVIHAGICSNKQNTKLNCNLYSGFYL